MLKKCLSILLVSVMIFSVFTVIPFSATAEEIEKPFAGLSNDDVTVSGTNSLGNMLAEKYEESAAEAENTGSGIYAVEVEGRTARVDVRALVDAQLVVSIFDEEGKTVYGSGMTDVTPDDNIVELTLEVGTIPQFFLIRAFLLDKITNQPLCKQFENDYYTQKMQEFFSKTTEDFEEDKVLNLDDNEENNFLVYNEDTIRIENEDDSTNVVAKADDKNKEYIIENIDEHIASLKDGDIFSYDTGDGDLLIIKISSIKISGTTAIIQGAEMELQEAFDFIRIDSSSYTDKSKYTPSDLGESVEYLGETDAESDIASTGSELDEASTGLALMDLDVEHSHELNFKFGEEKEVEKYYNSDATGYTEFKKQIYGEIGLKLAVNLKVFYDERLFGGRDVELSVTVAYKASLSLKAKLNLSKANSLGLGGLFFEPVPGVTISLTPSIKISGKLKAAFAVTYSGQIGFQHKNGNNEDLGKSPKADFTVDFEGELFIGLSLEPQISVLGDVAKAKAEAIAGLRIKAKTHHSTADAFDPEPSEKHFCSACIEGDVSLVLELKLELALFNNRDLSWDAELVNAEWKLCDFYFSVDHMEFGLNKCPYREYKCIVTLLDKSRQPLANTTVNDTAVDENGAVKLYLKAGSHQLQIKKDGKTVTRTLRVSGAEKPVYVIDFDRPDNAVGSRTNGGTVVNQRRKVALSGKCGDNAYYTLYQDGELIIEGTGAIKDYESRAISSYPYSKCNPWYKRPYSNNPDVTKVIIEEGITRIGNSAFDSCPLLQSVSIPKSVTEIGEKVFSSCDSLYDLDLPSNIKTIGKLAFSSCTSLTDIDLPNSLCELGEGAFFGCTALSNIVIPQSVEFIASRTFYECLSLKNVIIMYGTNSIEQNAFYDCSSIESLIIPDSVKTIGHHAFESCTSLKNISLSNILETIDYCAFNNCVALERIRIPDSVIELGNYLFSGCSALKAVDIGNCSATGAYGFFGETFSGTLNLERIIVSDNNTKYSSIAGDLYNKNATRLIKYAGGKTDTVIDVLDSVKEVDNYAFSSCSHLEKVIISDSVERLLGYSVFANCKTLKEVFLGESVSDIVGHHLECASLTNIIVDENNLYYSSLDGNLYNKERTILFQYALGKPEKQFIVPEGVQTIESASFFDSENLEEVIISNTVTSIKGTAFHCCDKLKKAVIPMSVTSIDSWAFRLVGNGFAIYGYSGSYAEEYAKNHSINFVSVGTAKNDLAASGLSNNINTADNTVASEIRSSDNRVLLCEEFENKATIESTRPHLIPDTEAVLIILSGTEDSAVFNAESLLYIAQGTVDESGEISFAVQQDFGDISWVAYIFGECDHSSPTWKETKRPTEEGEGMKALVCDHCGEVLDTQTIEALPKKFYLGDADGNEEIDINDATFILRYLAKIDTPFTKEELMRGDVDGSGDLELPDVTAIQYYLANMKTTYHIGELVQ